jgi:hypothetical protein
MLCSSKLKKALAQGRRAHCSHHLTSGQKCTRKSQYRINSKNNPATKKPVRSTTNQAESPRNSPRTSSPGSRNRAPLTPQGSNRPQIKQAGERQVSEEYLWDEEGACSPSGSPPPLLPLSHLASLLCKVSSLSLLPLPLSLSERVFSLAWFFCWAVGPYLSSSVCTPTTLV